MSDLSYSLVPKDFRPNLRFRRDMTRMGVGDIKAAEQIWVMCSRDLHFWVNTFGWTYDPRLPEGFKAQPFITYEFQDEVLWEMEEVLGKEDYLIEKSRDMGASWLAVSQYVHHWLFKDYESFLMISRKKSLVDNPGDPKSLFWKVDFLLANLPKWMLPSYERTDMRLYNADTKSHIDGESTTGDAARGDRRTSILLDEFASDKDGEKVLAATADATNSRLFNSTAKGVDNAFYMVRESDVRKKTLLWVRHPLKAAGLYSSEHGNLIVKDTAFVFPSDYPYILDGKARSPWYDAEEKRRVSKNEMAQEVDINYLGSGYQFFDIEIIQQALAIQVQKPYYVGELQYDHQTGRPQKFVAKKNGQVLLWIHPTVKGEIPRDADYVAGADISVGTGASNSCLTVCNKKTGEKVLEFATPHMNPSDFAVAVHAVLQWFRGPMGPAFVIWDGQGPGREFGKTLTKSLGYRNVYYKQAEDRLHPKISDIPGYFATTGTQMMLLGDYRQALGRGEFVNRSLAAVEELKYFIHKDGTVVHSRSVTSTDPTGAKHNHGDRVMADALCYKARGKSEVKAQEEKPVALPGSMAFRRDHRVKGKRVNALSGW